jgi:hypothetical protein
MPEADTLSCNYNHNTVKVSARIEMTKRASPVLGRCSLTLQYCKPTNETLGNCPLLEESPSSRRHTPTTAIEAMKPTIRRVYILI